MPESTRHHVEEVFEVQDRATKHLTIMHKAAERLAESVNRASEQLGEIGGVVGVVGLALGFKSAVERSLEFTKNVENISRLTGTTSERATGLVDTFAKFGLRGEEANMMLLRMSRRGAMLEERMAMMPGHAAMIASRFRALGVDISKGPEASLERIAQLVAQRKMGVGEVSRVLGIMPMQAQKLMPLLERGPAHLKESIDKIAKSAFAVTEEQIEQMKRIEESKNRISLGYDHIRRVVGVKLLPIVEQLMTYVEDHIDEWTRRATRFAEVLGGFLERHHKLILDIGKALLLNFSVQKATGQGISGWATKYLPLMAARGANMMAGGAMAFGQAGGGLAGLAAATGPVLAVIAALALAAAAIYATFVAIRDNVDGVRTKLLDTWERIKIHTDALLAPFGGLSEIFAKIGSTFGESGPVGRFFLTLIPNAIISYLKYTETFLLVIRTIGEAVPKFWGTFVEGMKNSLMVWVDANLIAVAQIGRAFAMVIDWITAQASKIPGLGNIRTNLVATVDQFVASRQQDMGSRRVASAFADVARGFADTYRTIEATAAAEAKARVAEGAAKREAPAGREERIFDFRGSSFHIDQRFAEGFDPDRVYVAFTNKLATSGERRMQAGFGFAPLFGVR